MTSDSFILPFGTISLDDRPRVGGKGGSLGELTSALIPVPPGFVVTTDAFSAFLDALDKEHGIRNRIAKLDPEDVATLNQTTSDIRTLVQQAPTPKEIASVIAEAYSKLGITFLWRCARVPQVKTAKRPALPACKTPISGKKVKHSLWRP